MDTQQAKKVTPKVEMLGLVIFGAAVSLAGWFLTCITHSFVSSHSLGTFQMFLLKSVVMGSGVVSIGVTLLTILCLIGFLFGEEKEEAAQ